MRHLLLGAVILGMAFCLTACDTDPVPTSTVASKPMDLPVTHPQTFTGSSHHTKSILATPH